MTNNKDGNPPDIWQKERQEIINTKKISATHKIKHWFDIFDKLVLYDEDIDKKIKRNEVVILICAVAGTIIFFGSILVNSFKWLPIDIPLFLIVLIFYNRTQSLKKLNIENHFRLYTYPLLRIFEQEASPNERIKLNLDFSNPEQKPYLIQNIPNTSKTYPKIDTNFYKITWLNAEVAFTDKTQLKINIIDLIRARTVSKRNRRGRIKMKIKRKIKQTITVKILFDKTQYQPSPETSTTQNLVEQADGYSIKIKTSAAIKTTNTTMTYDQHTDINPLLAAIAQAYAAVKPI